MEEQVNSEDLSNLQILSSQLSIYGVNISILANNIQQLGNVVEALGSFVENIGSVCQNEGNKVQIILSLMQQHGNSINKQQTLKLELLSSKLQIYGVNISILGKNTQQLGELIEAGGSYVENLGNVYQNEGNKLQIILSLIQQSQKSSKQNILQESINAQSDCNKLMEDMEQQVIKLQKKLDTMEKHMENPRFNK